jgi:hypothetical protein
MGNYGGKKYPKNIQKIKFMDNYGGKNTGKISRK